MKKTDFVKRFRDSYLLREHVCRRLKSSGLDSALVAIHNSPMAAKAPEVWDQVILHLARKGSYTKAFSVFNDMKKRGAKPTGHTYSALMESLFYSSSPNSEEKAKHILEISELCPAVVNNYLKLLLKNQNWDTIVEVIEGNLPKDDIFCSILLQHLAKNPKEDILMKIMPLIYSGEVKVTSFLMSTLCMAFHKLDSLEMIRIPLCILANVLDFGFEKKEMNVDFEIDNVLAYNALLLAHKYDSLAKQKITLNLFFALEKHLRIESCAFDVLFSSLAQMNGSETLLSMYFEAYHDKKIFESKHKLRPVALNESCMISLIYAFANVLPKLCHEMRNKNIPNSRQELLFYVDLLLNDFQKARIEKTYRHWESKLCVLDIHVENSQVISPNLSFKELRALITLCRVWQKCDDLYETKNLQDTPVWKVMMWINAFDPSAKNVFEVYSRVPGNLPAYRNLQHVLKKLLLDFNDKTIDSRLQEITKQINKCTSKSLKNTLF